MKFADLFHLKPMWFFLLIVVLAGAFILEKCSTPERPEEALPVVSPHFEQVEQKKEEKIYFDEQCRDVLLNDQWPVFPLFQSAARENTTILDSPEWKVPLSQPVILLKPLRKKAYCAAGRSVQKFAPDIFGKNDDRVAYEGGLISAVRVTIATLEAQSILYGIGPLSDCSGIFHRILMGVKKRYPDHQYPPLGRYRNSRDLARWYHERGELVLIKNALKQSRVIRPGVVLFFGRNASLYKNLSVKTLLALRGGIDHVGVVVSVTRNKNGEVINYKLFHGHGRKGKTPASTTNWHKRKPRRTGYPPFGNGRQRLVAAAWIIRL